MNTSETRGAGQPTLDGPTEYEVQGDYGDGWECVTTEDSRVRALDAVRVYRDNEPGVPFRVRRVAVSS